MATRIRALAFLIILLSCASPASATEEPAATAASVEELGCKADELGVRSNLILAALNETQVQGAATLSATKLAPMGSVDRLGKSYCIDPENLKGMTSLSFALPSDWECQSRKEGEPWPCPTGVSSSCRYYDADRTASRRSSAPFGGSTGIVDDTGLAELDDMCIQYYCHGLGAAFATTSQWNTVGYRDPCCAQFSHFGDKVLSNATIDALGGVRLTTLNTFVDPTTTAQDPPVAGWNPAVAEVCGASADAAGSAANWFFSHHWGYQLWYEDPEVAVHFVHTEINRFEMGPSFGIQYYTPQLDTLRVRTDGTVSFKPHTADFEITVYEDLQYEPSTTVDCSDVGADGRRLGVQQEKNKRMTKLEVMQAQDPTAAELTAERFRGSCHPSDGCMRGSTVEERQEAKKRQLSTKHREESAVLGDGRDRRLFAGVLMTSGSFTMMAGSGV